jgi:hypothetical protein
MIRVAFLLILAALALSACATTPSDKPAVCDGKHRRPENLYGSVLDPASHPKAPAKPGAPAGPASIPSCA